MNGFDFHCPTRIVFGPGRIAELGELTAGLDVKRALIVSDPGIEEVGHTQQGEKLLRTAGLETRIFDGLAENPTTDHVSAGLAVALEYQPDVIVAIGGGSSMDCAKGINFLYSCGGQMQDYWGVGKATTNLLPMVAVPTTAGTGSEAQSFALISDAQTHAKMACGDQRAAFRIAVLDPELTITMPERVTALTGIDAISHAVETFVSTKSNPLSMSLSREAWRLLAQGFPRVLEDPSDLTARGWMQQGACLAGSAIENSMLGAAHALANPLTANYGITHGEAVGLMLPSVVLHNAGNDPGVELAYAELVAEVSEIGGQPLSKFSSAGLAIFLQSLCRRAGLARTLEEAGVEEDKLPMLAAEAAEQWTGTFNPVKMTTESFLELYRNAY